MRCLVVKMSVFENTITNVIAIKLLVSSQQGGVYLYVNIIADY
ncbi:hypothetical protein UABAM_01471 [Candidatus Uabimicrobium amorphum]|uniref:Uncharacterized protein n=1 Tax=Uabimicrobium amorphum TaxID=2596890 RepID=A0A5S9IL86_UABAM|nr:hypothetical protein UABAM_01471 [Candidatus Uabimicrobium amorphum]